MKALDLNISLFDNIFLRVIDHKAWEKVKSFKHNSEIISFSLFPSNYKEHIKNDAFKEYMINLVQANHKYAPLNIWIMIKISITKVRKDQSYMRDINYRYQLFLKKKLPIIFEEKE